MFVRRRPLLGAAMIGGTAYLGAKAGQRSAQNQYEEEQQQAETEMRLQQLEANQARGPAPAPMAPAAPAADDLTTKLVQLKNLADQGVLTPEEFASAKAKLLAG